MPIACLFAHDPDPRGALLLDRASYASCRRCGAGLVDRGEGWTSPLSRRAVLRRARLPVGAPTPAGAAMRFAPDW